MTSPLAPKIRSGLIPITIPNWDSEVSAEYEFKTSVIEHQDGSEQRAAERQTARVNLGWGTMLTEAGAQRHLLDMKAHQDSLFTVPSPWRFEYLTTVTANVVTVYDEPFWAVTGAKVILESDTHQEIAEIESVDGAEITLTGEPSYTFAAGDKLYHAQTARIDDKITLYARTDRVFTGDVSFAVNPGYNVEVVPDLDPPQFEDRDVLETKPNWGERPKITWVSGRDNLDHGSGVIDSYNPEADFARKHQFTWTFFDALDAEEFVAFFIRQQGKRGSFWMPTWMADVTLAEDATQDITVSGTEVMDAFEGDDVFNVLYHNGQMNRVSGYSTTNNGEDTRIAMTDAWDSTLPTGTTLSFCPRWRWATDKLAVDWRTSSVAEIQTTLQTLANEAAE